MTEDEFSKWAMRVIELSPKQARDLKARLSLTPGTAEPRTVSLQDDWLLNGVCTALRRQGLLSQSSQSGLLHSKAGKAYQARSAEMQSEAAKLLGGTLNRTTQAALAYTIGQVLIAYCRRKGLPAAASIILGQIYAMREAVEAAYPGYIAAGLLGLVVTPGQKKKEIT